MIWLSAFRGDGGFWSPTFSARPIPRAGFTVSDPDAILREVPTPHHEGGYVAINFGDGIFLLPAWSAMHIARVWR